MTTIRFVVPLGVTLFTSLACATGETVMDFENEADLQTWKKAVDTAVTVTDTWSTSDKQALSLTFRLPSKGWPGVTWRNCPSELFAGSQAILFDVHNPNRFPASVKISFRHGKSYRVERQVLLKPGESKIDAALFYEIPRASTASTELLFFCSSIDRPEQTYTILLDNIRVQRLNGDYLYRDLEPTDSSILRIRRPTFTWQLADSPKELRSQGLWILDQWVELCQAKDFSSSPVTTLPVRTVLTKTMERRADKNLTPGSWFWRVVSKLSERKPVASQIRQLTIPKSATYVPIVRQAWSWQEETRPILAAQVEPHDAKVTATINGTSATVVSHEGGLLKFQPTGELSPGVHTVEVIATTSGGEEAILRRVFCNKQPARKVSFREDHVMLIDGAPFFPLGAYRDPSDYIDVFDSLLEAKFTVGHSYYFSSNRSADESRRYLRGLRKGDLRALMEVPGQAVIRNDVYTLQRRIAELMDEDGLLLWNLADEPELHGIPAGCIAAADEAIKQVDPWTPTVTVYSKVFKAYSYSQDIFESDPYPASHGRRPIREVYDRARLLTRLTDGNRPVFMVLGAHDFSELWMKDRNQLIEQDKLPCTWPPPEQIRAMNYMALAGGATGIIWYWAPCRPPAWSEKSTPMKWYNLPQDAPKVWQALVNVNTEMTQLMPWLLAKRQSEDTITLRSPFAAWSRQIDNRRILIVVNLVSKPADLKLELSAFGPVALYDWVTGQTVPTEGDTFTTQYSGYHVGIYEIRHTDTPDSRRVGQPGDEDNAI